MAAGLGLHKCHKNFRSIFWTEVKVGMFSRSAQGHVCQKLNNTYTSNQQPRTVMEWERFELV